MLIYVVINLYFTEIIFLLDEYFIRSLTFLFIKSYLNLWKSDPVLSNLEAILFDEVHS